MIEHTDKAMIIQKALRGVYGTMAPTGIMAQQMTQSWDKLVARDVFHTSSLEEEIIQFCWNWASGGGAAEIAAKKVIEALETAGFDV